MIEWKCPYCGELTEGKFCGYCGKPRFAEWVCSSCFTTVTSPRFCTNCGAPKLQACRTLSDEKYHKFVDEIGKDKIGEIHFHNTLEKATSNATDLSTKGDKSVLAWYKRKKFKIYDWNSGYTEANLAILHLAANGKIIAETCQNMFLILSHIHSIDFNGSLDTSKVTDMSCMFYGCNDLIELDMTGLDTSSVTNMDSMFADCIDLTELDVTGFNTSSVTNMSYMFNNCRDLSKLDVTGFNTSSVTNMSHMFAYCRSLTELDVTGFNTSSVTNMSYMFNDCIFLTELDVTGFNTSSVTDMSYMFKNCNNLCKLDVTGFNASSTVKNFGMFNGCNKLASQVNGKTVE